MDGRLVRAHPQGNLRALVVIANPTNLDQYKPGGRPLVPLDMAGELERARTNLNRIAITELAFPGSATLDNILRNLRDVPDGYDILYLVCHGALIRDEPRLWLENENGNVDVVAGSEFMTRLRELQQQPRLVVLASCQSAGTGNATGSDDKDTARSDDEGVLAALGPRLAAEAGIPAVLGMQGNVTMYTVGKFMSRFFEELQRHGQIDRAVAVARGAVRERFDCWMPVLFMRLRQGHLWSTSNPRMERFEKWDALLNHIAKGRCTPILGSGLVDSWLVSPREIAQRWAETYHFPMALHDYEDLPKVAQYLAIHQDQAFTRDELSASLRREMLHRYGTKLLSSMPRTSPDKLAADELAAAVGKLRRDSDATEPHRVLSHLPFAIYLTTNPDNLLAEALADEVEPKAAAKKKPQVEICRWKDNLELPPSIFDTEPDYQPTVARPLVYHLFGRLSQPESLVLTQDDYFTYLIGVSSDRKRIPHQVGRALANTSLLFLGFRIDDWNFRVLFRSLLNLPGNYLRQEYTHVAVQIDPENGRALEPERARRYLESLFQRDSISVYWGSTEAFVTELQTRWMRRYP
jgi:hypothetical protein